MSPDLRIVMARTFCIAAHSAVGQERKYTYEPYWEHPEAVVTTLREIGADSDTICTAWLHDVVEDTEVELSTIYNNFGFKISKMVSEITDVSIYTSGNRALRKKLDRNHLSKACPEVKTVKLADLIDNTKSIVEHDPKFAAVYLKEKAALLEVLKEGNSTLWSRAEALLVESAKKLNIEI